MVIDWQAEPVKAHLRRELKQQRGPKRPTQTSYRRLVLDCRNALYRLTPLLGEGNFASFEQQAKAVLAEAHAEAAAMGRRLGGDPAGRMPSDALIGMEAVRDDAQRLYGWMEQMRAKDRRYYDEDGNLREPQVRNRLNLYTNRLRSTANKGFLVPGDDDALYDWVMLAVEHCSDCPGRQEGSPYTKRTLPGIPGDGSTECKVNCACVLVRYYLDEREPPRASFARATDSLGDIPDAPLSETDEEQERRILGDLLATEADLQDWFAI